MRNVSVFRIYVFVMIITLITSKGSFNTVFIFVMVL